MARRPRANASTLPDGPSGAPLYGPSAATREQLDPIRKPLLAPFGVEFSAPSRVALYLYAKELAVIENFNDNPVSVSFTKKGAGVFSPISLTPMDEGVTCRARGDTLHATLPPRSLLAVTARPKGHE